MVRGGGHIDRTFVQVKHLCITCSAGDVDLQCTVHTWRGGGEGLVKSLSHAMIVVYVFGSYCGVNAC